MDPQHSTSTNHVLKTPIYILGLRVFQAVLALIILAMSARLIHDAYLDEEGLALAMCLITWLVVAYIVVTEKVPALHKLYNLYIVLALDLLMVILWLATWAAVASRRARFKYYVNAFDCFDDGDDFDSKHCFFKRDVILFKSGLALFAAIAGLGALIWLLFIVCLAWGTLMLIKGRKEGRFNISLKTNNTYQMEPKLEQQPGAVNQQAPIQPQPTGEYPQQAPYQQQSPYQGDAAYATPQGQYSQQSQQAYAPYPPQQQQHEYRQPTQSDLGDQTYHPTPESSELAGSGAEHYGTPPPAAVSPPPQHH